MPEPIEMKLLMASADQSGTLEERLARNAVLMVVSRILKLSRFDQAEIGKSFAQVSSDDAKTAGTAIHTIMNLLIPLKEIKS